MSSDIKSYVSRYVVPFYFDYENEGYNRICGHFLSENPDAPNLGLPKDGKWINIGFWENNTGKQSEMDVFSYLPDIFLTKNGEKDNLSNLGTSFVYSTNGKLFELEYESENATLRIVCPNLGILLYRNGIGFAWYEIEIKDDISCDIYTKLQHDFKELARTRDDRFKRKIGFDPERKEPIYEDFCMGIWLSEIIAGDKVLGRKKN